MKLYIVFKEGIYRHECGGVYSTLAQASAVALQMIKAERDDYHDYTVTGFSVDEVPTSDDYGPDEPHPVERFSRVDPRPHDSRYKHNEPDGITVTRFDQQDNEVSKIIITGE